jgi:hypothetical protein
MAKKCARTFSIVVEKGKKSILEVSHLLPGGIARYVRRQVQGRSRELVFSLDMAPDSAAMAGVAVAAAAAGAALAVWCGGAAAPPEPSPAQVAEIVVAEGLKGKCALVTGAAGAIGAAVTRALQRAGVNVAMVDVSDKGLAAMEAELGALPGGRVLPLTVDISDGAAIERAVARTKEEFGMPDILVNVAGILSNNKLAETSVEEWEKVMNINVTAAFLLSKACCPAMAAKKWGRVVNITSWAWKSGGLTAVRA